MTKRTVFVWATVYFLFSPFLGYGQHDYRSYHAEIINCEQLISERKFKEAIRKYDSLFNAYDFVFLKDYKVAAQLCAYTKDNQSGLRFIEAGILKGWSKKDLQKDKIFTTFREDEQWKNLLQDYDSLHEIYLSNIDLALRAQVREMLKKRSKKGVRRTF